MNDDNPLNDQPGWAAPDNAAGVPPVPPTGYPSPEGTVPPPPPSYSQPPYGQPFPPGPIQPGKKSKTWLWITLAITIPLFLCCLGVGGIGLWVYSKSKPAIDITNKFYAAAKDGDSAKKYTCDEYKDDIDDILEYLDDQLGYIDSYDFTSFETDDYSDDIEVSGTVTRDGRTQKVTVTLVKEDGDFRVCYTDEDY